ncbi:hypothetical protein ACFSR9_12085 [Deinococcus taklimakanensis]|uniref:Right handed beta helix domain-containing protein n=1 Tax=Deinococcus taklimakanensis TaxID=536443 RepID=A0ABW5P4F3_9DEIO
MTLPKRKLLPLEAAQALDTLHGVVRVEQDKNNAATLEAIEQTRSITGVRPLNREPRVAAPDGSYPADPPNIYRVVRGSGIVDVAWDGNAVTAETPAAVTINQLGRVAVDATYYGVADGAPAQTFMDALAATRKGGTLVCPKVTLIQRDTCSLWIRDRPNAHITVQGNGLVITADPTMRDNFADAKSPTARTDMLYRSGFVFLDASDFDFYNIKYDGRLDVRTPVGSDMSGVGGPRSAWLFGRRAHRIRLNWCQADRAMMDGFTTGAIEDEFVGNGERATQEMLPTDIVLWECEATRSYRQAISPCGSNNLHIHGGKYNDTGRAGKSTSPRAGMCWEAFFFAGFEHRNLGGKITGRPEVAGNMGLGISMENGTVGLKCDDIWVHHNNGSGLSHSGQSGVMDNHIHGTFEHNCQDTTVKVEVSVSGVRNKVSGKVRCDRGVAGASVSNPALDVDLSGLEIVALDPRPGEACGNVLVETVGGTIIYDPITGKHLDWARDANGKVIQEPDKDGNMVDKHNTVPIPASGGKFDGLTLTNATYMDNYYAVLNVDSVGARVTNNKVQNLTGAPLNTTTAVKVVQAVGYAAGNKGPGYATEVDSKAPGEPLTPLTDPASAFSFFKTAGRGLSGETPPRLGLSAELLSRSTTSLIYRLTIIPVYDAGAAGEGGFTLYGPLGYQTIIRSAQTAGPSAVKAPAFVASKERIGVMVPADTFISIPITVDVELQRA